MVGDCNACFQIPSCASAVHWLMYAERTRGSRSVPFSADSINRLTHLSCKAHAAECDWCEAALVCTSLSAMFRNMLVGAYPHNQATYINKREDSSSHSQTLVNFLSFLHCGSVQRNDLPKSDVNYWDRFQFLSQFEVTLSLSVHASGWLLVSLTLPCQLSCLNALWTTSQY